MYKLGLLTIIKSRTIFLNNCFLSGGTDGNWCVNYQNMIDILVVRSWFFDKSGDLFNMFNILEIKDLLFFLSVNMVQAAQMVL